MNRREVIATGAATAVALSLPVQAFADKRILLAPGVLENRHTHLVLDYIAKALDEGRIAVNEGWYIDLLVELRDPTFKIELEDRLFDCGTGWIDEPGPVVTVIENGVEVTRVGVCRVKDYRTIGDGYYMRRAWLGKPTDMIGVYDKELHEALGDRVSYDFRWLEAATKMMKSAHGS